MHLCYYLTSHGLGHSVRACAVCDHLPASVHVTFRTGVPESFFRIECPRSFDHQAAVFDCGCLQRDSVTVDVGRTLRTYAERARANEAALDEEVAWCRDNRIDTIVCDAPPFPLEVAARAGVPSVVVANFTWFDIYREYVDDRSPFVPLLHQMRDQYARADMLLEVAPSLPMPYFRRRMPVGIVGRSGQECRLRLCERLGIDPGRKLALLYLGTFGMEMAWERLESFSDWAFLCSEPLDQAPRNYFVFDKATIGYRHVAASVDAVISKLGYGIYSSCLLNGVPLIYLPRSMFAEYAALEQGVEQWGGGFRLSDERFRTLDWGEALRSAATRGSLSPRADTGARACADAIVAQARR